MDEIAQVNALRLPSRYRRLTPWEQGFIDSMGDMVDDGTMDQLTDKQRDTLRKLYNREL